MTESQRTPPASQPLGYLNKYACSLYVQRLPPASLRHLVCFFSGPVDTHSLALHTPVGRIYCLKASECHRPLKRICASESPFKAAVVAAPILKLCDLYRVGSRPQNRTATSSWVLNHNLFTAVPSRNMNKGPAVLPRCWM